VRVAAENEVGMGMYAEIDTEGAVIPSGFPDLPPPTISERTAYTVTLSWDEVTDWHSNSRYGHQDMVYEIWWAEGVGIDFEFLTETIRTQFVVNIPSHNYEY
jgi:hypothetical protein